MKLNEAMKLLKQEGYEVRDISVMNEDIRGGSRQYDTFGEEKLDDSKYIILAEQRKGAMTAYFFDDNGLAEFNEDNAAYSEPFDLYTTKGWSRFFRDVHEFDTKKEAKAIADTLNRENSLYYVVTVARARVITVYTKQHDGSRYILPYSQRPKNTDEQ